MDDREIIQAIRAGFCTPGVIPEDKIDDQEWRYWHQVGVEHLQRVKSAVQALRPLPVAAPRGPRGGPDCGIMG
jgi:hypothetical protein